MIIRNMTRDDLETAAEVFYTAFNSVGEKWAKETCLKRIEQYFNPDTCFVAESDGVVVGFLTGKLDNVLDHQELYIDILAVDPKNHKLGVGTKLLEVAETYAKSCGYKGMWLSAGTELPSFDWYSKIGFKQSKWVTLYKIFK